MNKIINADCLEYIQTLESESVDCVLTDPPYLYLKHKLDRPFDEDLLFSQLHRVLKKNSMLAIFGRGESLFRWCNKLATLGFKFKEELVWEKDRVSSPFGNLSRKHELCIVFAKGKGMINKVKVPYLEMRDENMKGILQDVKRIASSLNNKKAFSEVQDFLETNQKNYNQKSKNKHNITAGIDLHNADRSVHTISLITNGIMEQSVIKISKENYDYIHPTQKPIRLLERILALISKEGDLVLDTFAGSGSTAVACINTNRNFLTCELDKEYFDLASERINNEINNKKQKLF